MKPSAPDRLRPLAVSGPQDPTQHEVHLRRPAPARLHEERTSLNLLPQLRTMLYAIPAESRRAALGPAAAGGSAAASAPRIRPAVLALCALLTGGALALALHGLPAQAGWTDRAALITPR